MSDAKHTPGPWVWGMKYVGCYDAGGHYHKIATHPSGEMQPEGSEWEANARLMASAPVLLAERDQLRARVAEAEAALETIRELADEELRRLGAVPGSNVAQIEANAAELLKRPE